MDAEGNLLEHPVEPSTVDTHETPVILGRAVLEEVWKDQEQLILPSCVFPAPLALGVEKRKLSANQWHSVGMIHLVITLICIWGHSHGRQ